MATEKPMTQKRELELLGMAPTGREILHNRGNPETWADDSARALSEDGEVYLRDRKDVPHHEKLSVRVGRHVDKICGAANPRKAMMSPLHPEAAKFMERVDAGDLRKPLVKSAYVRLEHDDNDAQIKKVLLEELAKLFASAPPSLLEELQTALADAAK